MMPSPVFLFRISKDLKEAIAQASAAQGKTPSEFGREAVVKFLKEAQKVA